MKKYLVKIDAAECIGYGQCVNIAPELFELEAGVARVVVTETSDPDVLDAAAECPMSAILVEEAAQAALTRIVVAVGVALAAVVAANVLLLGYGRDRHDPVGRLSPVASLRGHRRPCRSSRPPPAATTARLTTSPPHSSSTSSYQKKPTVPGPA